MQRNTSRPTVKRSYLNLDAIFGHVYSNVMGEPLTPTKIATFYLVRTLFEAHFGKRYVKSKHPFTCEEKNIIFQHLFALMTLKEELPYRIYRMIVRTTFGTDRNITANFYCSMEQLGSGLADINLNLDDEFYTNVHPWDPSIPRPLGDPFLDSYYAQEKKNLAFSSSHSFMYRWMKKLMAQHTKTTPTEMFEVNNAMRKWILAKRDEVHIPRTLVNALPHFIDCSTRARLWVHQSLYYIQKNPRFAFTYKNMLHVARIVEFRHKDIVEAHLLEAAVHVQLRDSHSAVRSMKTFFDLSMFELNENMAHALRTHRLAVPNQNPLLYAPILHARICRMFGDNEMAHMLLHESLQQAQLRNDETCHQMANLELHIIDVVGCEALLEDRHEELPNHIEKDRRVQRKALRHIDDLHTKKNPGIPCCSQTEDDFELRSEMDSIGKLVMMMKNTIHGKMHIGRIGDTGFEAPMASDLEGRGRKLDGYAKSVVVSNLIRNGMYLQAQRQGKSQIVLNTRHTHVDYDESEPWAVTCVNMAYTYAAIGDFDTALDMIDLTHRSFPDDLTWQGSRHVVICTSIVNFEKLFLKNCYSAASMTSSTLQIYSEIEYRIRKALVLAATGRHEEGASILTSYQPKDIRGQIRFAMQLASIYTSTGQYERTQRALEEAMKVAANVTLKDVRAMIVRRMATMMMCRKKYDKACELLSQCSEAIENFGTFTERACMYMTAARSVRMRGRDPRMWLKQARALVRGGHWPGMEKLILTEIAALHKPEGLYPDENRLSQTCEQFGKLMSASPGKCDWLLI